jgi:hypothetical protein
MGNIEKLLADVTLPRFKQVEYHFGGLDIIGDLQAAVKDALAREDTLDRILPGQSVAITAGSREISQIAVILKTLCDALKEKGAHPFIIPAMGSHGGATAEGQRKVIADFGVTEESIGVPVRATMETISIGHADNGIETFVDQYAYEADVIIPVGRIKPHTDFRGDFESGIMKMLAIGVGKQYGASVCHKLGMENMSKNVLSFARKMMAACSIPFGIGIIENAFHDTWKIAAVPGELIEAEEPQLLLQAKSLVPVVPFDKVDIIIVEEMGKDISGTGIDGNVVGRSSSLGNSKPFAERMACFALTDKSHGNANGMGTCDAITRRFFENFEMEQTYPNAITSAETTAVKMPAVMPDDENCVKFCIKTCTGMPEAGPRIVWIKNSLSLDKFYISETLEDAARANPQLKVCDGTFKMTFDKGEFVAPMPV